MSDLGFIIVLVIILALVARIAMRRAHKKKNIPCTRCEGSGYIRLGDDEDICNRCKGTGQLFKQNYSGGRKRYYENWERR